jgi:hypothetical protein
MLTRRIQGAGGQGGGGVPASLSYIGKTQNGTDSATFTFNSVNIGTASSDRLVIAVFHASGLNSVVSTGVTCSAGTLTTAVRRAAGFAVAEMYYINISSGTTADFSITFSSARNRCDLAIYTLTGYNSATPSDTDNNNTTTTTITTTLDIPTGSVAIYAYTAQGATTTGTFSSATETYDTDIGAELTTTAIGGYQYDGGTALVQTLTTAGARTSCMIGAVWG